VKWNKKLFVQVQTASLKLQVGWHVAGLGDRRGTYKVLMAKPEGKRLLGRPRLNEGIILK
jgi:hypothetical protein